MYEACMRDLLIVLRREWRVCLEQPVCRVGFVVNMDDILQMYLV